MWKTNLKPLLNYLLLAIARIPPEPEQEYSFAFKKYPDVHTIPPFFTAESNIQLKEIKRKFI